MVVQRVHPSHGPQTIENQRRGTRGKRGTSNSSCITCNDNGIAFGISAYQVSSVSRTARWTPLPSVLQLFMDDMVTTVLLEFSKEEYIVLGHQARVDQTNITRCY
jgi:hypothetical protein